MFLPTGGILVYIHTAFTYMTKIYFQLENIGVGVKSSDGKWRVLDRLKGTASSII
jgi:hypothetical protein